MSIYLAKYRPLNSTPEGQRAAARFNIPPYVDGSCRRENEHYQKRADTIPVFLACQTVWKELLSPAILTDQAVFKILGSWERVRSRPPIRISFSELNALRTSSPRARASALRRQQLFLELFDGG